MADDPATPPSPSEPPSASTGKRRGFLRRHPFVAALIGLPLVVLVVAGLLALWIYYAAGGPTQDTTVVVPKGAGVRGTAERLENAGVIDNTTFFLIGVKLKGADRSLKAGEYRFPAGASLVEVIETLEAGRTVVRRFTVAEGLSVTQVIAQLRSEPALMGPVGEVPPEGSLLPETYNFSWGDTRAAMLKRMRDAMNAKLEALWENRQKDLPLETPEEALILASIVEKETSLPEERGRIAGVFINRLELGMPLQSDPTIVYGITKGEPLGRPIKLSELQGETTYNTYTFVGLPPTPIANPGAEALAAVMNPEETDELYFVADGTGGHAFSRTYDEHIRNVQKWRQFRRQQEP
jgi:UPF0755 protein